ncbi:aldo/keto reductase [Corynebacterium timonense]|uniref:2,5-diketo-D-gluconate reductase A n=1 Tax=Corynebacterium timonense TaxID=441500 RepID=A0A1H1LLW0_9CORY|nr:aldo/keto reductase [Corynebacterium timonense]SDR75508.1 2,5-diketo-D-gluconate reductase A [Corynebacterium timonense]
MIPRISLNDATSIPQLGYGLCRVDPAEAQRTVEAALEAGYRHFDTAHIYHNEEGVGRALAATGVPREELYITTKLWNDSHDDARAALARSLDTLQLDRVDLYLIHWPRPAQDLYVTAWETLIELRADGLATSIGVSNFGPEHLDRLDAETGVTPAVNQVELHPLFQNRPVREAMRARGIVIEGWGPLGGGYYSPADLPDVVDIARARGVSPAQVVLRWHLQNGVVVFPKTSTAQRMRENLATTSFELTEQEMARLDALDQGEAGRKGPHPAHYEED